MGDQHDQLTFELVGILKPTGGPIDNAVLIDIADFQTLHIDPLRPTPPVAANAALVGVTAPFALFQLQRQLTAEPDLTATLPGVALSRLWSVFGGAERALELLSLALLVCAGLTLLAQTMSQVERRTREMALYHAMGAPLRYSLGLPIVESALIGLVSWAVAWCLLRVASTLISEWLQQSQGILLPQTGVTDFEGALLVCSVMPPVLLSALPHWLAWRRSQLAHWSAYEIDSVRVPDMATTAPAYAFLGFFDPVPDEVPLTDQRLKASQDGWDSLIPGDASFVPDNPPSS